VYSSAVRDRALVLRAEGRSVAEIARTLLVSRAAVSDWLTNPSRSVTADARRCFVCAGSPAPDPEAYSYLLGQYLGDGYIAVTARVTRLRIACAERYPLIAAEVDKAMRVVSGNRTSLVVSIGYTDRGYYWKHWPCLFPQHGRGPKHARRIELAGWQREIVEAHPWPLIRGLIHSDRCRSVNRVTTRGKPYAYPRYFFSNESGDIIGIFCAALDRVAVPWRLCRPNLVSVARRAAIAELDRYVGPKS
jgi:hypothetical protein